MKTFRLCPTVLLFLSVAILCGCEKAPALSEREVATRVLAEQIAKKAGIKSVLVISNPFTLQPGRSPDVYAFETAGIEGLKKGFGADVSITVAFPELKPEVLRDASSVQIDPKTTTPLSFLVTESGFSKVVQGAKADVVVSLIGLPVNISAFKEWSQGGAPRFALLLPDWRMIGGQEAILDAFRSEKLIAAVVNRPNVPSDNPKSVAGDYKTEFEKRYLLVTAENIEQLLRDFPGAFALK